MCYNQRKVRGNAMLLQITKHENNKESATTQSHIATPEVGFSHTLSVKPLGLDRIANNLYRHTDLRHQLLIFLSGECKMVTDDYSCVMKPGDVFFSPALSYYGVEIVGDAPYERVVIFITPNEEFDKLAYEIFDTQKPINANLKQSLLPFVERFKEYADLLSLKEFSSLAPHLIQELLYICLCAKNSTERVADTSETLFKKVLAYIDENWTTIKNIRDISNALFISPSYLYEIFNKKLNIAPKAYLTQKRLQAAHAYLISGITPNEVSQLVGFDTYTSFYRACKTFYGKTPQKIWVKKT